MGLKVTLEDDGLAFDTRSGRYEFSRAAYYVTVVCEDDHQIGPGGNEVDFREAFARKQDAEAAIAAIKDVICWEGTWDEINQRVEDFGRDNLNRLMVGAMQW